MPRTPFLLLLALTALGCSEPEPQAPPPPAEPAAAPAHAGPLPQEEVWRALLAERRGEEALSFCAQLAERGVEPLRRASGHACMANLALMSCPPTDKGRCAELALEHVERGIDLAPEARRLHLGRLRVLADAGRAAELAPALIESLALRPGGEEDLPFWLSYAAELLGAGRLKESIAFAEALRARFPDSPDVLATLGAALTDLSRHDRARELLEHGLDQAPEDAGLNWTMGWHHERTGSHQVAKRFFETALANAPDERALRAWGCDYGRLLEQAAELEQACRLQREHCADGVSALCEGRLRRP